MSSKKRDIFGNVSIPLNIEVSNFTFVKEYLNN